MHFLSSHDWLFGQRPTDDDQEKLSKRYVFKVHHYNSSGFDLMYIVNQNDRLLDFRREKITVILYGNVMWRWMKKWNRQETQL